MKRCECGARMVRVRFDGDWGGQGPVRLWICEDTERADTPFWRDTMRAALRMMRENRKRNLSNRKGHVRR